MPSLFISDIDFYRVITPGVKKNLLQSHLILRSGTLGTMESSSNLLPSNKVATHFNVPHFCVRAAKRNISFFKTLANLSSA